MVELLAIALKGCESTLGFRLDRLNVEKGRWIVKGYEISKYNKDVNLSDYKEEYLVSFESHKIIDKIYGYTY